MTVRQLYEFVLVGLNKVKAPGMLLNDFNIMLNQAILTYIEDIYNYYEINQMITDELRVLSTIANVPIKENIEENEILSKEMGIPIELLNKKYTSSLPSDYLHLLNCKIFYIEDLIDKCKQQRLDKYESNKNLVSYRATKMTAKIKNLVESNYYMKPTFDNPYYSLIHTNTNLNNPTNPSSNAFGTDIIDLERKEDNFITIGGTPKTFKVGEFDTKQANKIPGVRYGNSSTVRLNIEMGELQNINPVYAEVVYLKNPQYIELSQSELDLVNDESMVLEFPDNVCIKIANKLINIILENSSDPRLQTHVMLNNQAQQQG